MSPVGLPFQNSLHGLLTWFLDPRSLTLDGEGAHRPAALASPPARRKLPERIKRSTASRSR